MGIPVEETGSVELSGIEVEEELLDIRKHMPEDRDGEELRNGAVFIESGVTEDLEEEALARELIRAIQQKRKEAGLEVSDKVSLSVSSTLLEYEDLIRSRVNVTEVSGDPGDQEYSGDAEAFGRKASFSFSGPEE